MIESFEKFMKSQCEDCAFEFMDDAEYCTECGLRFKDAYTAGMERSAEIVEAKERDRYERVGDPRVPHFESYYAAAIRKEAGE